MFSIKMWFILFIKLIISLDPLTSFYNTHTKILNSFVINKYHKVGKHHNKKLFSKNIDKKRFFFIRNGLVFLILLCTYGTSPLKSGHIPMFALIRKNYFQYLNGPWSLTRRRLFGKSCVCQKWNLRTTRETFLTQTTRKHTPTAMNLWDPATLHYLFIVFKPFFSIEDIVHRLPMNPNASTNWTKTNDYFNSLERNRFGIRNLFKTVAEKCKQAKPRSKRVPRNQRLDDYWKRAVIIG